MGTLPGDGTVTKANGRMVIVIDDDAMMRQAQEKIASAEGKSN